MEQRGPGKMLVYKVIIQQVVLTLKMYGLTNSGNKVDGTYMGRKVKKEKCLVNGLQAAVHVSNEDILEVK